jgi:hypothetical protein
MGYIRSIWEGRTAPYSLMESEMDKSKHEIRIEHDPEQQSGKILITALSIICSLGNDYYSLNHPAE